MEGVLQTFWLSTRAEEGSEEFKTLPDFSALLKYDQRLFFSFASSLIEIQITPKTLKLFKYG